MVYKASEDAFKTVSGIDMPILQSPPKDAIWLDSGAL